MASRGRLLRFRPWLVWMKPKQKQSLINLSLRTRESASSKVAVSTDAGNSFIKIMAIGTNISGVLEHHATTVVNAKSAVFY